MLSGKIFLQGYKHTDFKRKRRFKRLASRKAQRIAKHLENFETETSSDEILNLSELQCLSSHSANDSSSEQSTPGDVVFEDEIVCPDLWNRIDVENLAAPIEDFSIDKTDIVDELRNWSIKHNISHRANNDLLKLLREAGLNVPNDSRTVLQTPRSGSLNITKKSGGDYCYYGIKNELIQKLCLLEKTPSELQLTFNIDGLPIFTSKNISLWPIQCTIDNVSQYSERPFVISLFCGTHKPENLDFLDDFVNELDEVTTSGLGGIPISRFNIICDAPARAMVKGIKQFNGRFGCDFCDEPGVHDGFMMFLQKGNARTDESFRAGSNPEHHKKPSPFLRMQNINMIRNFPLDPMHAIDLGVTKRLVLVWTKGPRFCRLSANQIDLVSKHLISIRHCIPYVFNRKPRGLNEVKLWKATEFHTFLLYTGVIVLRKILNEDQYVHFLCLAVAMRILFSQKLMEIHVTFAEELLTYFFEKSKTLYGRKFISYNVHSLLHISDVARWNGSLRSVTAYRFENNMSILKRSVRGTGNPIVQICNRLAEMKDNSITSAKNEVLIKPGCTYQTICGKFIVTRTVNEKTVMCEVFKNCAPLFMKPCDSRILGIYKGNSKLTEMTCMDKSQIKAVAVSVPVSNTDVYRAHEFALLPLVHID